MRSMLLAGAALVAPNPAVVPAILPSVIGPKIVALTVPVSVGVVTIAPLATLAPEQPFESIIQEAAARYALAPALIRAVILTESRFDPRAVSAAGAQGLMQLMPALAADLGVADAFDPRANIMAGARYLSALIGEHNGDLALALASYNAGPGVVKSYGGIPPFEETRRYVKTILDLLGARP